MSRPATGSVSSPGATPRVLGKPFSCWSLAKLRDYLIGTGYVTHDQRRDDPSDARTRGFLAGHQDMEGQQRP